MTRIFTTLILSLAFFQFSHAQPDTLITYLKNTGREVYSKDSADYIMMVISPDTAISKDLYNVYEFYPDGKTRAVATSITGPKFLTFDGASISYFQNGKRKTVMEFKNGKPDGEVRNYYPNGQLYTVVKLDEYNDLRLIECHDSTGKVLAEKGKGQFLFYGEEFENVISQGSVSNGRRDGEWRGQIADSGSYICTFRSGILKSGTSFIRSGNKYSFKQFKVAPTFDGGGNGFNDFIKKNLVYPAFAKQHHITGPVHVGFKIQKDGSVTDVKIEQGNVPSLNEEALRIIRMSPMWSPGLEYGFPVVTDYSVSVNFYM